MSDEFRVGERVLADTVVIVPRIGGPRFQEGTLLEVDMTHVIVALGGPRQSNGPIVRLRHNKIRRPDKGELIALEGIPAGSAVVIDPATGHVRRAR